MKTYRYKMRWYLKRSSHDQKEVRIGEVTSVEEESFRQILAEEHDVWFHYSLQCEKSASIDGKCDRYAAETLSH